MILTPSIISDVMYKTLQLAVALLLGCLISLPAFAVSMPIPAPPALKSNSYFLLDFNSGHVMAEHNPDMVLEPASITKLLTTYVAFHELQNGNLFLDEQVTISEKAWRTPGSRMFVEVGKQVSVEDLLIGIIVQSGNDASVALAEHIGGTEETFAELMNRHAQLLGMDNSHFVNSTGLPDSNHYTTARDIAKLSSALIKKHPDYYKWYSQRKFVFNGITQYNRNKLLDRDPSVDGLKTGHTDSAGYCLASSAVRGDMRLIAIVMGTSSEEARADASQALLNYGFRFFETHKMYQAGSVITQAKIWKGEFDTLSLILAEDMFVTVPKGRYDELSAKINIPARVMAPITGSQHIGTLNISVDGTPLAEQPLYPQQPVNLGSLWQRGLDEIRLMFE